MKYALQIEGNKYIYMLDLLLEKDGSVSITPQIFWIYRRSFWAYDNIRNIARLIHAVIWGLNKSDQIIYGNPVYIRLMLVCLYV